MARHLMLLALPLLAGCSTNDFVPTLTFAIPDKYQAARSTRPPQLSYWWKRFGSHELDALMDQASIDNLDIAQAIAQLRAAEARIDMAGAALWPTINYSDTNQRAQSSGTMTPGTINKPNVRSTFTKVFQASYVLDVWGLNRDALEAAVRNARASAYQVEVVRLATRAAVASNYLIYAANWERVTVARRNLANAERVLKVIRDRNKAGTASELDISQQLALVETQRAAIPPLRLAAETSRVTLALLLGQPAQAVRLKRNSVRSLRLPAVTPGLPVALLLRRPDIRAAEADLAAADANVDVARKALLPSIQLTGQAGFQSAMLSTLLRPESFVWSIAAGLTQTVFDGGLKRSQIALNKAQRQQLLEAYRKSIVAALTDVDAALITVRETAARERAQRAVIAAARRAFELSEDRLKQGIIDLTQLLTTQNTLFQAEDALIQVRLARLQAVVSLYQALGGDWEEPLVVSRYVN